MNRLAEKTAIVTGGAVGIGRACALRMAEEGAKVAIFDVMAAEGRALAAEITAKGGQAAFWAVDVSDGAAMKAAIDEAAAHFGGLQVLVNNAGISGSPLPTDQVSEEDWDRVQAINVKGVFLGTKHAIPHLRAAKGGSIINLGSISWMLKNSGMPVYLSAKAAALGLTRALARDLGPHGIRSNSVVPGWIMTERQVSLWLTPASEAELMRQQCLKEKLYPPDIARMVLWLAADDSRLVTAQQFIVDGGWF